MKMTLHCVILHELIKYELIKYNELHLSHSAAFVRTQRVALACSLPGFAFIETKTLHLRTLSALEIMSVFTMSCSLLGSWNTK